MGLYYIQTNTVCIIVLAIILVILNRTNALPARRVAFTRLISICIAICVSDIFAWYFNGKSFVGSRALQHLSNMVYFGAITAVSYQWMVYVNLRLKSLEDNIKRRRLDAIPLLVMLAVILVNPLTGFLYTIDANGVYSRGVGIYFHWLVSWGYLFYVTWIIVKKIRSAGSRTEKGQLMPLLWFIVPPAAAAVLQMIFYGLTSTQCGLTISILIITFTFLSDETSRDVLTGLNNRRALENRLLDQLQKNSVNLTVLMCDIDRFKIINDTLGHTAGDMVLKRMADSLKRVCGSSRAAVFLCRYGGDEFVICCYDITEEDLEALIARIEKAIADVNAEYSDNLSFGISVGSANGICNTFKDVEGLIGLADGMMYEKKKAKKAARE